MYTIRLIASALFVIAIPLLIVLSVVRVAANWEVAYGYSYTQYDVPSVTGIEREELDRVTGEIIWYFQSAPRDSLLDIHVTIDGESVPLYNTREVIHMQDVQHLFRDVFRVHDLVIVYAIAYIAAVYLWSRERTMRHLAKEAILGGVITVGLLGITALVAVTGFDTFWTQFHLISFDNDFWLLNPQTDRLIQMFPTGYWFDVTLAIGVVSMMIGGMVALTGLAYLSWYDRARAAAAGSPRRGDRAPRVESEPAP